MARVTGWPPPWAIAGSTGCATEATWAAGFDWLDDAMDSDDEGAACVGDSELDVGVGVAACATGGAADGAAAEGARDAAPEAAE